MIHRCRRRGFARTHRTAHVSECELRPLRAIADGANGERSHNVRTEFHRYADSLRENEKIEVNNCSVVVHISCS